MKKETLSRRSVLKTLTAGVLGSPLVGSVSTSLFGQAGTMEKGTAAEVLISVGNAAVPLMFEVWGRPPGMNLPQDLRMGSELHLTDMLKTAKDLGATGIEYYVGWGAAEPEEGKWDWSIYKQDAREIKENGYQYIPYIWIQNLPRWVRNNPAYPRASNVDTGLETDSLSIFADKTREAYDRFFAAFAQALGTEVDILRVGTPNDYGETAYPAGAGSSAFPLKNIVPGFWVNEPDARAHFKARMKAKYGSLADLNRAWDTQFSSFDGLDYPKDPTHKRYWLDFVNWYHEGFTEELGKLLDIVRKHFPTTPLNINLGWPFEKINLGQDLTGIVKMCAQKNICVRTPTGPIVPFLYTKRVATAARHYPPPKFSSEPVDGNAPRKAIAGALFKDLTTGVNWHFDYPPNIERGKDLFDQYRHLWRSGAYPEIDTALFFPTSAHRLDDWTNWRGKEKGSFSGGFPEGLMPLAEKLRDSWDYDVVDERLVNDNMLAAYRMIFWPIGLLAEAETLRRIHGWFEQGGILLVNDLAGIRTVEGDAGTFAAFLQRPSPAIPNQRGRMIRTGKGYVFDGQGDSEYLTNLIAHRGDLKKLDPAYPAQLTKIVPVGTVEGVLVSQFKDGILLFNRTESTVTTELNYQPGTGKAAYEKLPQEMTLPPLALRWIDGKTGEVT